MRLVNRPAPLDAGSGVKPVLIEFSTCCVQLLISAVFDWDAACPPMWPTLLDGGGDESGAGMPAIAVESFGSDTRTLGLILWLGLTRMVALGAVTRIGLEQAGHVVSCPIRSGAAKSC